jgi:hypothetical protein
MGQLIHPTLARLSRTPTANSAIAGNSAATDWEFRDVSSATNLTSGTLPDARLSSNVPLKDAANVFTADNTLLTMQFSEAPVVGTGRTNILFNKRTGQPGNFSLVSRLSDNVGEANDDWIVAFGYNITNQFQPETAGEHALIDVWESRFKQGADWIAERYVEYVNAAAVFKRPLGLYVNLATDFTEHLYQTDKFELRTTNAAFDAASAWLSATSTIITYTGQLFDHLLTGVATRHRIGQGGNDNFFTTWVYDATPAVAKVQQGTWGYTSGWEQDALSIKLQTNSNGSITLGSATSTLGAFAATAVGKQASTVDLKDAWCLFGFQTNGGATPLNLDGGTLTAGDIALASNGDITLTGGEVVGQVEDIMFSFPAPVAGDKIARRLNYDCLILSWTITSVAVGSVVVDINSSTYANYPTTASIAGSEKPTLSAAQKNEDATLSTWTTAFAAGSMIEAEIDSASGATNVVVTLKVSRS